MGTEKRERQKAGRQARLDQARVVQTRRQRFRLVRNLGIIGVVVVVLLIVLAGDDDDGGDEVEAGASSSTSSTTPTTAGAPAAFAYGTGVCPNADGSSPRTIDFTDAPQQCIDPAKTYTAVWDTSEGTIRTALDVGTTPGTVNNFVVLSRYHYFDGTVVFRADDSIGIIQGGSPHTQDNSDPGPGYDLPDEGFDYQSLVDPTTGQPTGGPYAYAAGDLVMARSSAPNGGSAQWFFCVTDACANLDSQGVYVTFGSVVEGQDALQTIYDKGLAGEQPTINAITIEEA